GCAPANSLRDWSHAGQGEGGAGSCSQSRAKTGGGQGRSLCSRGCVKRNAIAARALAPPLGGQQTAPSGARAGRDGLEKWLPNRQSRFHPCRVGGPWEDERGREGSTGRLSAEETQLVHGRLRSFDTGAGVPLAKFRPAGRLLCVWFSDASKKRQGFTLLR